MPGALCSGWRHLTRACSECEAILTLTLASRRRQDAVEKRLHGHLERFGIMALDIRMFFGKCRSGTWLEI